MTLLCPRVRHSGTFGLVSCSHSLAALITSPPQALRLKPRTRQHSNMQAIERRATWVSCVSAQQHSQGSSAFRPRNADIRGCASLLSFRGHTNTPTPHMGMSAAPRAHRSPFRSFHVATCRHIIRLGELCWESGRGARVRHISQRPARCATGSDIMIPRRLLFIVLRTRLA